MYQLTELQNYLKRINAGHFLDVATGDGDFLLYLLDSFNSFESATGIDTNTESLKAARLKAGMQKVDLIQANVRKLPFEENYFDVVAVSNSLHHFEYPEKALQSMLRVLVPGGLIIINEMISDDLNPAQRAHLAYHSLKAETDRAMGIYHRNIYSKVEIMSLIGGILPEPAVSVISEDPPMITSREKLWQFFRKIDDYISGVAHLSDSFIYEEKARVVKEMVETNGFQKPPQLGLLIYKN